MQDINTPFFNNLWKLYEQQKYTDIDLNLCGKIFHCHRIVLSIPGSIFVELFTKSYNEAGNKSVQLNISDESNNFRNVLQYIYTKNFQNVISLQNCLILLYFAAYFRLKQFEYEILDYIKDNQNIITTDLIFKQIKYTKLIKTPESIINKLANSFSDFSDSFEPYLDLSPQQIILILNSPNFTTKKEINVVNFLANYIINAPDKGFMINQVTHQKLSNLIQWLAISEDEYLKCDYDILIDNDEMFHNIDVRNSIISKAKFNPLVTLALNIGDVTKKVAFLKRYVPPPVVFFDCDIYTDQKSCGMVILDNNRDLTHANYYTQFEFSRIHTGHIYGFTLVMTDINNVSWITVTFIQPNQERVTEEIPVDQQELTFSREVSYKNPLQKLRITAAGDRNFSCFIIKFVVRGFYFK